MNNQNYNFPVELQPIYLGNDSGFQKIAKQQAVVRTDTMDTLGIVSDGYGLIKHGQVIDSFREASAKLAVKEKISLANNGARLFYQMTFPKVQMEVQKGDIVQMMMIAKNSYNGWNSLSVILGAMRLVCLNGMVVGTQFMQFHFRHVGNVGGLQNEDVIEQYTSAYKSYVQLFSEKTPLITAMARKEVKEVKPLFDREQVKMPQYLLEEAKVSFEAQNDRSIWGYYNSLTFAITHKMRKESQDRAIVYGVEAWKAAENMIILNK